MEWPNLQSYVTYVITWLHYKFISALPQYLCPPKLSVVTYGWKIPPNKSCDLLITRSRDKWKLPFHNTWSLQIWQSIYWSLEDTSHQVMWSFDHVVTWKIKKKYLYFNNIYGIQTWQSRGLKWKTRSPKSRESLAKWLRSHYLLDVLKCSCYHFEKIKFVESCK